MRFNDRLVAIKIKEGDAEAFEMLINSFKSRVFSYCLRMTNDYNTAEDLTQETFLKIYRGIDGYNWQKASISTWIYTICRNTCLNHLRDAKLNSSCFAEEEHLSPATRIDGHYWLEQRLILVEALNRLPVEEREMLLMKDYLDLPYRDIAVIMGIPTGTAKSRIHSIRAKLKILLSSEDHHEK